MNDTWVPSLTLDVGRLVSRLGYFVERLQAWGCPLPNCWAFIDGTVRAIYRYVCVFARDPQVYLFLDFLPNINSARWPTGPPHDGLIFYLKPVRPDLLTLLPSTGRHESNAPSLMDTSAITRSSFKVLSFRTALSWTSLGLSWVLGMTPICCTSLVCCYSASNT